MEKDKIKIKSCKKIDTFDANKKQNGWLLELVSDKDGFTKHVQGQAYLTVASPGYFKGFHLHAQADYFVTCIRGRVRHVVYESRKKRHEIEMGDGDFKTVFLPKGCPHGLENIGKNDAYVIIYRHPSWSPDVKEQMDIDPRDIEKEKTWKKAQEFIKSFINEGKR